MLKDERQTFDRWRYFGTNVGGEGMLAMVNTERAFSLAKAARVLIDEGEISGLAYEVNIDWESMVDVDHGSTSHREAYRLSVTGREEAIP